MTTTNAGHRPAAQRARLRQRDAVLSVTDPARLRAWRERGMGPTPEARAARAQLLGRLAVAARQAQRCRRAGDELGGRRWQAEAARRRAALARYDRVIRAAQAVAQAQQQAQQQAQEGGAHERFGGETPKRTPLKLRHTAQGPA